MFSCYYSPEILNKFWTRGPAFSSGPGPCKLSSHPGGIIKTHKPQGPLNKMKIRSSGRKRKEKSTFSGQKNHGEEKAGSRDIEKQSGQHCVLISPRLSFSGWKPREEKER